jgi:starch phosphorylase
MTRARAFSQWKSHLRDAWPTLAIQDVTMYQEGAESPEGVDLKQAQIKAGSQLAVRTRVILGEIDPQDVAVELYYGPVDTWGNIQNGQAVSMNLDTEDTEAGGYWFQSWVSCMQTGQHGIAVRLLPHHPHMVTPHEMGLILWEATA